MKSLKLLAIPLLFAASAIAKDSTVQIKVSGMTWWGVRRQREKRSGEDQGSEER